MKYSVHTQRFEYTCLNCCFLYSPYGSTHQSHILAHQSLVHVEPQHPLHLAASESNTITVLDSGHHQQHNHHHHVEMKKLSYPHHNDHNNNGNIYQNLTPMQSSSVKSESHSPPEEEGSLSKQHILTPVSCKSRESNPATAAAEHHQLSGGEIGNDPPRCWTKI